MPPDWGVHDSFSASRDEVSWRLTKSGCAIERCHTWRRSRSSSGFVWLRYVHDSAQIHVKLLDTVANGRSGSAYRPSMWRSSRHSRTLPNPPPVIRLDLSQSSKSFLVPLWTDPSR